MPRDNRIYPIEEFEAIDELVLCPAGSGTAEFCEYLREYCPHIFSKISYFLDQNPKESEQGGISVEQELRPATGSRAIVVASLAYREEILANLQSEVSESTLVRDAYYFEPWFRTRSKKSSNADHVEPSAFPVPVDFREGAVPLTPPNMINDSEVQLLYWISKNVYSGKGALVELGSWLGGSTVALVKGLLQNPNCASPVLHTFDSFGGPPERAGSFYRDWETNVSEWRDQIQVYAGDLLEKEWTQGDIEILFTDAMKSVSLAERIVTEFFPHLLPNSSYIIHQDFKYHETVFIPPLMYRLREYCVPVLNLSDSSTCVFHVVGRIPQEILEFSVDFASLTESEIDQSFEYASEFTDTSDNRLLDYLTRCHEGAKRTFL